MVGGTSYRSDAAAVHTRTSRKLKKHALSCAVPARVPSRLSASLCPIDYHRYDPVTSKPAFGTHLSLVSLTTLTAARPSARLAALSTALPRCASCLRRALHCRRAAWLAFRISSIYIGSQQGAPSRTTGSINAATRERSVVHKQVHCRSFGTYLSKRALSTGGGAASKSFCVSPGKRLFTTPVCSVNV